MSKSVAVIICAAGASSRFGGSTKLTTSGKKKKPFVNVDGRPAFLHSVELFSSRDDVKQILLAIAPEDQESVSVHWGANLAFFNVKICIGGAERFDTVKKAMSLVKNDIDLIAVHDAVRCCVTKEWVDACFAAASKTGAAILACPVVATIKRARDKTIIETVDRTNLYEAQTPQVFSAKLLREAYDNLDKLDRSKISVDSTGSPRDDSQLVEALGHKVTIVETDSSNIKITRPADVAIAEAILKSRPKSKPQGPIGPYIEAQW
jgi:2-C-methyl-D-erythritol 4-phosphate cytidylyltransferase